MLTSVPPDAVVLALDPASHTGYAIGKPRALAPALGTVKLGREHDDDYDVFGRAVRWFSEFCDVNAPAMLAIEQPIPPSQKWGETHYRVTFLAHGLFGIFTGIARHRRIVIVSVPARTWRKYFLGAGNLRRADAKQAALRLCRQLKWSAPDDNAADAAGIWAWGCAHVAPKAVRRVEPLFIQSEQGP